MSRIIPIIIKTISDLVFPERDISAAPILPLFTSEARKTPQKKKQRPAPARRAGGYLLFYKKQLSSRNSRKWPEKILWQRFPKRPSLPPLKAGSRSRN